MVPSRLGRSPISWSWSTQLWGSTSLAVSASGQLARDTIPVPRRHTMILLYDRELDLSRNPETGRWVAEAPSTALLMLYGAAVRCNFLRCLSLTATTSWLLLLMLSIYAGLLIGPISQHSSHTAVVRTTAVETLSTTVGALSSRRVLTAVPGTSTTYLNHNGEESS